jgi:hypothetical protein
MAPTAKITYEIGSVLCKSIGVKIENDQAQPVDQGQFKGFCYAAINWFKRKAVHALRGPFSLARGGNGSYYRCDFGCPCASLEGRSGFIQALTGSKDVRVELKKLGETYGFGDVEVCALAEAKQDILIDRDDIMETKKSAASASSCALLALSSQRGGGKNFLAATYLVPEVFPPEQPTGMEEQGDGGALSPTAPVTSRPITVLRYFDKDHPARQKPQRSKLQWCRRPSQNIQYSQSVGAVPVRQSADAADISSKSADAPSSSTSASSSSLLRGLPQPSNMPSPETPSDEPSNAPPPVFLTRF